MRVARALNAGAGPSPGPGGYHRSMRNHTSDSRVVMTLDAGGTSLRFSAMRGLQAVSEAWVVPSESSDLDRILTTLFDGFERIKRGCPEPPSAISFAFPGPADYPRGIIGDLPNLPAFRGGVPLGPMLEAEFGIPTFVNNDGHLFAYGEAIAGFLPHINGQLERSGSPKRFKNLLGVTLGTGFGGGIVTDGAIHFGDNSVAGSIWLLRNKRLPHMNAEEGACARAVRRTYSEGATVPFDESPQPHEIFEIGSGKRVGDRAAALGAFRALGEVAGDAIAQASALLDCVTVVGGGVSAAWPLFLPALIDEMNSTYVTPAGDRIRRLSPVAFNLEEPSQLDTFLRGDVRHTALPRNNVLVHDALARTGVGISRLGTSRAIAVGAYAFALNKLDLLAHS